MILLATMLSPRLEILPTSQRQLWPELVQTPRHFTLYGGTALALRLAHRPSLDFYFFSNEAFDPDALAREIDLSGRLGTRAGGGQHADLSRRSERTRARLIFWR